jgi:hypothetical protein
MFGSVGISPWGQSRMPGGRGSIVAGGCRNDSGRYENSRRAAAIASQSAVKTSSPHPETEACIIAPPISSRVEISPVTFSATRGDARYIEALPSTMPTQSVNAGM